MDVEFNGRGSDGRTADGVLESHGVSTRIFTRWPIAIIEPIGDLSVWDAGALNHEVTRIVAANPQVVVVDLGQTGMISSLGLGVIVNLHRGIARNGGQVRIARPSIHARGVIERARLDEIFEIYDTIEAALVM